MNPIHRPRELGALRSALDRRDASLIHVTGSRGVGKTTLIRTATAGLRALVHRVPPLPEPRQRTALAACIAATLEGSEADTSPPEWDDLFRRLVAACSPHPLVLVLDDAHRLTEARARVGPALARALVAAREQGASFHVILVGAAGALPDVSLPRRPASPPEPVPVPVEVRVPPLSLRAALPWLPGTTPEERIQAYAVFGGVPAHLRILDPDATLWTNVRRTLLEPGAPLADRGMAILERDLQIPARYVAVLAALSLGEADWGIVHQGVPGLTTSGQVAPYLLRL